MALVIYYPVKWRTKGHDGLKVEKRISKNVEGPWCE